MKVSKEERRPLVKARGAGQREVSAETGRRTELIRSAVKVFADRGFDAATLRDVTQRAGANIAAVNYYFRSKDELLKSTLEHCLGPMNRARMLALEAVEKSTSAPTIEAVVEALVRPVVELELDDQGGRAPIRLLLQARAIPRPFTNRILAEQFDTVHLRFLKTLAHLLPHLSPRELASRYEFARGAVLQIVAALDTTTRPLPGGATSPSTSDNEFIVRNLVAFIAAGFSAPSADRKD